MKSESLSRYGWLAWLILWIPVLWLAALIAQCYQPNMNVLELIASLNSALANPFRLSWTTQTPRLLLLTSIAYLFGIGIYYATRLNRRPKEEHGSAQWGKAYQLCRCYLDKIPNQNILLTEIGRAHV